MTKRFRFRLETVLRVRRVAEEQARAQLMVANRDVMRAATEMHNRSDRYDTLPRPTGAQTRAEVDDLIFTLDHAAHAVTWSRAAHTAAVARADYARSEWAAAEQRVRALERLEERAREAHATEVRRADDRLADELATTRARLSGANA